MAPVEETFIDAENQLLAIQTTPRNSQFAYCIPMRQILTTPMQNFTSSDSRFDQIGQN